MNAPITAHSRPRIYDIPREDGGPIAAIPAPFADPAHERAHRKQQLAAGLRLLARHGVEPGLAGHLSARDPEHTDSFWVNPVGVPFSQIRASDLLLIDPEGRIAEGEGPVNLSGIPYHHAVQRARPDVVGIVHAHSLHASTWTAFGETIPPIIADLGAFHDDQVVFVPDRDAGRDAVAAQFTAELGQRNVLLWRNHAHWTTGTTVEAAVWRFIAYERAARIYLAARAAGTPLVDVPAYNQTPEKREAWAYLSFLPYWDEIVAQEPDLLD
jgi:L-ribulose-5-phosphate 4-epimerase